MTRILSRSNLILGPFLSKHATPWTLISFGLNNPKGPKKVNRKECRECKEKPKNEMRRFAWSKEAVYGNGKLSFLFSALSLLSLYYDP